MTGDFFLTNWFLEAMRWIYSLTCAISESGFGNVFLTILISTILLRALTIFSDIKTRKSSAKMAEVQPEIQRLQKKYANDPRRFQAEQTKLMKEKGVSMWGSCLPMLITMPLFFCFIAAFRYWGYEMNLRLLVDENAMELFKSFKFLWINNIWQPDNGLTPVLANGASFLATPQLSNLLYLQEPGVGEKLVEMGLAVTKVYQGGVSYQLLSNDAAIAIYDAAIQPFLDVYKGYNNGWFVMSILAGGTNFRELGGYEADEGKHVKWGQIWRGIPTCKLTGEADRAKLDALGLRLILDLRSTEEARREPDYVPDGARLVQICGLCAEDGREISFAPDDIDALMKGRKETPDGSFFVQTMYERMLFGNKAFKELFRALEAGETPILFHCSAGKDRTGVAAMLILLALGASDETICADYLQTNLCRKAEIEARMAAHADEIAKDPRRENFHRSAAGVSPEAAPFVLRTIRAKYGNAENYLEKEYGLTPARLMRLRRMYLE